MLFKRHKGSPAICSFLGQTRSWNVKFSRTIFVFALAKCSVSISCRATSKAFLSKTSENECLLKFFLFVVLVHYIFGLSIFLCCCWCFSVTKNKCYCRPTCLKVISLIFGDSLKWMTTKQFQLSKFVFISNNLPLLWECHEVNALVYPSLKRSKGLHC